MKKLFIPLSVSFVLLCGTAFAASVQPGSGLVLQTPDNWNSLDRDFETLTHPTAKQMLNCVDTDPAELQQVGWLLNEKAVQGAYCVSFRKSGMAKALNILKTAEGNNRKAAADKFADTVAGVIHAGYKKRGVEVEAMIADIIDAGADVIMVMDGNLRAGEGEFVRSETVFLHGDSMLSVSTVFNKDAPPSVMQQLEAIPLSVQWK